MRNSDIQNYFLPGEKLLWLGQPKQGLMFNKKDLLQVPFSLLWGGFAIFWESSVIRQINAPVVFRLWGVPFVLIGLYLIVGRFAVDAFVRARTQYAVSDQRIIILRDGWFSKILTVSLERLPALDLDQRGDGTGTISFGTDTQVGYGRFGGMGAWTPALSNVPQFLGVKDVRDVFNLILRAQSAKAS
ncbi:PH domain-containing protein [Rhizobium sp. CB3171]|uniref:PH domain-containing protein n=1 Tax=Rhizobium sp. CB3171 TaxID=3039157 RepID=UPI0024B1C2BC|nr:PH domain-containing protein [Rhizobium sp. CB3171]WFU03800.1 PH domain-containing protein [Rhizobium sp. CB3171]